MGLMECQVGDNVYPIWIDSRSKDDGPMIDWQFKIMDYFVDDMAQEIYNNLDKPHNQNCVTRVANEDMTLQECHAVVLHFQKKGFEATWYQKDDKKPIIVVSWGLPFDIDEIDTMYKICIQLVNEPYKVVHLLAEYVHYVYVCSNKDICVIPLEHLDYIAGDYLTYQTFTAALQEAEESYSLKIHTGTLDDEDWVSEYICIQKKDKKIKQCVVKDLRPMAVGLFFYLTK